jgi:PAS domain S-box-containing protein
MASALAALEVAIIRHPIILPVNTSAHAAIERLITPNSNLSPQTPEPHDSPRIAHVITSNERSRYLCIIETEEGRIVGTVTAQDLMATIVQGDTPGDRTVQDLMSPIAATRYEHDLTTLADLHALNQYMQREAIGLIPILNPQDQPVGLISETSLLCALHTQTAEPAIEQDPSGSHEMDAIESPPVGTIARWQEHAVRYRALFEDAHDAIIIANLDGQITEVNHQAEVMFGYSRQELLGMHQSQLHPPEDLESVSAKFQAILQEKTHTGKDVRIFCKDGKIKYTDIRGKVILLGNTPIIQGIFHDITQRKQTEDTLRLLIEGTEPKQGQDFFFALVETLGSALNVDHVFLSELIEEKLKTLAIYSQGKIRENITYKLEGMPCKHVIESGNFSCESEFAKHFPEASNRLKTEAQSYVGVALFDQKGEAIGNLFIQDKQKIDNTQQIISLLSIFAARAAAEIERQRTRQRLEKLNQKLQEQLKKQDIELQEKEHFLQTLLDLDAFPLSVFWKDINSVYLGCNHAFLRDANLRSIDEIIGKNDYEMPWSETEADAYRTDDRQVIDLNQAKLGIIETQVQADGKQIWLETNKIPFHDLDGNVRGVLGIYHDVTERQRTEAELQQMSMRLNLALRSANIGIWDWDIVNNILDWDEQMFALYGIDQTLIHNTYDVWLSCLHPNDTEQANKAIQEALADQADYDLEFRIVRPDGEIRFLQGNALIQRDPEGRALRMVGTNYDITDRQRTEERLRQQLETIEVAVEGIAILRDDRYLSINSAHVTLFGYEHAEELIGQSWEILYDSEELLRFKQEIFPVLMHDRAWQGEAIAQRKDGSRFMQGLSLTLSANGDLICMCRDISERKQAEQQLWDAKESAELADRAKSNFLALMSHEIRTPINGVLGLAHLMQQTQLDREQQEYLRKLENSASSLSKIVNDILDFSKIEADKLSLDAIEFELEEILDRLQAVLALKADEKQLDLRFEVGDTVPRRLVGDPLRLGQVAINLVSNAIKFTDRGGVTVSIEECDRDRVAHTTRLRFSVHDTGIGLTPEQIKILFHPFTQVDPSTSRRQEGTGLGLTICQQLIALMGGEIEVRSELDRGSTFRFELTLEYRELKYRELEYRELKYRELDEPGLGCAAPEKDEPRTEIGDEGSPRSEPTQAEEERPTLSTWVNPNPIAPHAPPTKRPILHASILVVEDNDVNQLVARKVLEQFGLTVELAVNGRQAIAQVLQNRYDLILMDVRMPEMDGLDATRRIRRLSQLGTQQTQYLKDVPIIAMTAHAFESDRQRSLAAGMNDHLSKPIDPERLYATLNHWLGTDYEPSPPPHLAIPLTSSPSHLSSPSSLSAITSSSVFLPPVPESAFTKPPSFPGLNVSEGLERVYNDTHLYCELLQLFAEIYEPFASNLSRAFQHNDPEQIILLVHTLKGAAANVAATTVVEQSDQVLQQLRGQSDDRLTIRFESTAISLLLRSLAEVLVSIDQAIEAIGEV